MNLAIVGYRSYYNYVDFSNIINEFINDHDVKTIITGDCRGTDTLAQKYAINNNLQLIIHKANWDKYGKRAGPMRNKEIVINADYLIAFVSKESIGTWHTIKLAKEKGIPIKLVNV